MCGIQGGLTYIITALLLLVALVSPQLFILCAFAYVVLLVTYSMMTFKQFWGISYGKVILYSLICALLSTICMVVVFAVLLAVLSSS